MKKNSIRLVILAVTLLPLVSCSKQLGSTSAVQYERLKIDTCDEIVCGAEQNSSDGWTYTDSCWDSGIWSSTAENATLKLIGFGQGVSRQEARSNAKKNAKKK